MRSALELGDFVEAALVAAAEISGGQESLHHFDGGGFRDNAAAESEDISVVVFAGEAWVVTSCARAARTPGTLLAAMEMPIPEPQTAMPRSACFETTRSPTAFP